MIGNRTDALLEQARTGLHDGAGQMRFGVPEREAHKGPADMRIEGRHARAHEVRQDAQSVAARWNCFNAFEKFVVRQSGRADVAQPLQDDG